MRVDRRDSVALRANDDAQIKHLGDVSRYPQQVEYRSGFDLVVDSQTPL
jgi:hypothetical protein